MSDGERTTIKSGLYWRKSKWNGAKCVPVVLTAEASIGPNNETVDPLLSMRDQNGEGFSADPAEVTAKFSRLGTMTLSVGDTSYDIVGAGSGISKPFSQCQLDDLTSADRTATVTSHLGQSIFAAYDFAGVLRNTEPWRKILPVLGATVL